MKIGVDASFLRKPGTGIGVVAEQTLRTFSRFPEAAQLRFVLYLDGETDIPYLPSDRFERRLFLPWWKRDDVPRRILWERGLARQATADGCEAFVSLSQSALIFPDRSSLRHVMVIHDIVPFLFPSYQAKMADRLHAGMIGKAVPRAQRILAVSETTKRDLVMNMGISEERIVTAYPDCPPVFRDPVSDGDIRRVLGKYGLEPGYIYHGGGLEVRKNTERLLRGYADIVKRRDAVPILVISGRIHARRNRLATDIRGLIRKLGLGDRVKPIGFVPEEDLPALYRSAVCFAFPSLYEGFGLPIVEAMAVGTPVLAGRTAGAVPEIAGNAALLVDTGRSEEIASGLGRLLDDPTFREKLIGRGKERSRDFSWERFAGTLLKTVMSDDASSVRTSDASSKGDDGEW